MKKDWITTGSQDPEDDREIGVIVAPEKPKLAKPPLWKVTLLNDDYTPMEFVIEVLQIFFGMSGEKATQIMLAVHQTGKGVLEPVPHVPLATSLVAARVSVHCLYVQRCPSVCSWLLLGLLVTGCLR